jgi:hypothetical protein
MRMGAQELGPNEAMQGMRVGAAKDPLVRVEVDTGDLFSETWIPLVAVEFDFGKFRHASDRSIPLQKFERASHQAARAKRKAAPGEAAFQFLHTKKQR